MGKLKNLLFCIVVCVGGYLIVKNIKSNTNENGENASKTNASFNISIYFNESVKTYTVKNNSFIEVSPICESGQYITGIYDAKEGGQLYFDISNDGTCYTNIIAWKEDFPSVFYAQYSNELNLKWESECLYEENPQKGIRVEEKIGTEMIKTILCNPGLKADINVDFEICDASWGVYSFTSEITLGVGTKKGGYEKLNSIKYSKGDIPESYVTKTIQGTCNSKLILNRENTIYCYFDSGNSVGYDMGKFKNINIVVNLTE